LGSSSWQKAEAAEPAILFLLSECGV